MADEDSAPAQTSPTTPAAEAPAENTEETPPAQGDPPPPASTDRTELLQRARAFLTSPQVRHEDVSAKRRFLVEKGLTDAEIEELLFEVPPPAPPLPPRTYPQPPPSKVPYLLLNVFRAFTWIAGSSAALLLAYFRFLYPKIAQTYQARLSLRTHRRALLERMTRSLEDLKATQQSTFAVLPQPEAFREPAKYAECHGLEQLAAASNDERDDCLKEGRRATSAELFSTLETKLPWIAEEGAQFEDILWQTLTTTPFFQPAPPPPASTPAPSAPSPSPNPASLPDTAWTYTPSPPPLAPPLLISLSSLKAALPPPPSDQPKFQHTFQALSDLTGYIATQTYALPHTFRAPGLGLGASLLPEEEEVRREIRALKGLVLNRRSFMPRVGLGLPRPGVPVPAGAGDAAAASATPA
ncbi:hypothetical protein C8T65DRAFT_634096 [Cerioporus squamosus]|nr:hypothetical protein C8T65DRAFT_634096 [Cerioporus squamosus]